MSADRCPTCDSKRRDERYAPWCRWDGTKNDYHPWHDAPPQPASEPVYGARPGEPSFKPAQPAPAGFEEALTRLAETSAWTPVRRYAEIFNAVRAAHAKEVEETKQAACKWDHEHCPSCCKKIDEARAAGKREMAKEVAAKLIEFYGPLGKPSGITLAPLREWLERAGEEKA